MFDLKRFRKENGRITQMAMAEMFNCTQGNIYAIEASGRDLTDEQLNILKSKFGDEVVSKYIINLTLDKDNPKTFKEATHDFFNKREEVCLASYWVSATYHREPFQNPWNPIEAMIMSQSDAITDNDLDFFLTVISMFCEYNHTMHYSDRVFADITDNPGRTKRIILNWQRKDISRLYPVRICHTGLLLIWHPKGRNFKRKADMPAKSGKTATRISALPSKGSFVIWPLLYWVRLPITYSA